MRKEIEAILHCYTLLPIHGGLVDELTALFESKLEEAKRPTAQQLTYLPEHEKLRMELWGRVYAIKIGRMPDPEECADQALEAFDNKFNHQP